MLIDVQIPTGSYIHHHWLVVTSPDNYEKIQRFDWFIRT